MAPVIWIFDFLMEIGGFLLAVVGAVIIYRIILLIWKSIGGKYI